MQSNVVLSGQLKQYFACQSQHQHSTFEMTDEMSDVFLKMISWRWDFWCFSEKIAFDVRTGYVRMFCQFVCCSASVFSVFCALFAEVLGDTFGWSVSDPSHQDLSRGKSAWPYPDAAESWSQSIIPSPLTDDLGQHQSIQLLNERFILQLAVVTIVPAVCKNVSKGKAPINNGEANLGTDLVNTTPCTTSQLANTYNERR